MRISTTCSGRTCTPCPSRCVSSSRNRSVCHLSISSVIPLNVFCGTCYFCARGLYSNCHNVNPNATAVGGIYGYSHTCGGYDRGQAEYGRVSFADVGPGLIPEWMDDDEAVLFTDALPTGYFDAQLGDIVEGDVVVGVRLRAGGPVRCEVGMAHGCGPRHRRRSPGLPVAEGARVRPRRDVDFTEHPDVVRHLKHLTEGLGSDVLTLRMNQCPVERQWPRLLQHVPNCYFKLSDVVTHHVPLEHTPRATTCSQPSSTTASSQSSHNNTTRKVALGHALLSHALGTGVLAVAMNVVTNGSKDPEEGERSRAGGTSRDRSLRCQTELAQTKQPICGIARDHSHSATTLGRLQPPHRESLVSLRLRALPAARRGKTCRTPVTMEVRRRTSC